MAVHEIRRAGFLIIVLASSCAVVSVWVERLTIFDRSQQDLAHLDSVLGTIVATTSGIGAIALALVFITAQLSASRPAVLRELYRSSEVYVFIAYFVVTLILGYSLLALALPTKSAVTQFKVIDTFVLFACTCILLVVPVLALQLENLNPMWVAAKLSDKIRPAPIIGYGLTNVRVQAGNSQELRYELSTVGLRPREGDPFRPIHEVFMESVNSRDRVLFGKLFRYFLEPIAVVYGASWDLSGLEMDTQTRPNFIRRFRASWYTPAERAHLTLAILHYAVKRARNLLKEWDGLDIGRHGIVTGIGDLVRCLSHVSDAEVGIRISIYAILRVSLYYSEVHPFGRVEPLNSMFDAVSELVDADKLREATLCAEVLGWISVHTKQLSDGRSSHQESTLDATILSSFRDAQNKARVDEEWLPGIAREDPWRTWLD